MRAAATSSSGESRTALCSIEKNGAGKASPFRKTHAL
jgi:hypothetical protein